MCSGIEPKRKLIDATVFGSKEDDDRLYIQELQDSGRHEEIKKRVSAIACLMTIKEIEEEDGKLTSSVKTLSEIVPHLVSDSDPKKSFRDAHRFATLDDSERFSTDWAPGFGSAFLIKNGKERWSNLVLTAGHCLAGRSLSKIRVVFNFIDKRKEVDAKDVYAIDEILQYSYEKGNHNLPDYALLRLKKIAEGITPIEVDSEINRDGLLGRRVYSLGCPGGISVKVSGADRIKLIKGVWNQVHGHQVMDSDVAILGGNSGGPLIDWQTHKAIGITVRGYENYSMKDGIINTYRMSESEGERQGYNQVQRITRRMLFEEAVEAEQKNEKEIEEKENRELAEKGRIAREALSDRLSKLFEKGYKEASAEIIENEYQQLPCRIRTEQAAAGILLGATLIGAFFWKESAESIREKHKVAYHRVIKREEEDLAKIEKIQKSHSLNFWEAQELSTLTICNLEQAKAEVRNRNVYRLVIPGWSYEDPNLLYQFEVLHFKNRFCPEKIVNLLYYWKTKGVKQTTLRVAEALLNYMQKRFKTSDYNQYLHSKQEGRLKEAQAAMLHVMALELASSFHYRKFSMEKIKEIAGKLAEDPPKNLEESRSLGLSL